MDIKAFKMDGLGNDFVIIDNRTNKINLSNEQIVKICDREFIGCDQLIIIKNNSDSDASVEFFNSDGSPSVEMELGVWLICYLKRRIKIQL